MLVIRAELSITDRRRLPCAARLRPRDARRFFSGAVSDEQVAACLATLQADPMLQLNLLYTAGTRHANTAG